MHPCTVAFLTAAFLLAGCTSPATDDTPDATAAEAGTLKGRTMQTLSNSLLARVEQVHWANGTVPAQDACNPIGCARGESTWQRVTDLTAALPTDAAVQLEVDLAYAPHPLFGQAMMVVLSAGDSVVYAHTRTSAPGSSTIVATLLPRGTVEVVVMDFQPTFEGLESTFSLLIRIVASPTLVTPGVPAGLTLAGGDTLRVGADGEQRDFLLFGPDGARLGAFRGNVTLDAAARPGEYAVLLPPGGHAELASDNGDATMRPLGLRYEVSPPATVAQAGAMEAPWDVSGLPIGVGIHLFTEEVAASLAPLVTMDLRVTLAGPNGFLLDPGNLGGYITLGDIGTELRFMSALGDDLVTAGTYTMRAESTATYEAHLVAFAVYIDATA